MAETDTANSLDTGATSGDSHGLSTAQLKTVLQVSRALSVTVDLDALLHRIAEATVALIGCERASIFLHDPKTNELWSKVALQSGEIRLAVEKGVAGHCFRFNSVVHVPDAYADARFVPDFDHRTGFRTRDLLAAPMVDWDDRPVGVVQALNKAVGSFTEDDQALLRLLAEQAGVAVQRWKLQQATIQATSLRHEMELAKRVQESVLPRAAPRIAGLEAAGWMRPASINGGDCYDLWRLPSGELGVLVADASGHGMPAALVIAQVRALIRMLSETESSPAAILERVNRRLNEDFRHVRFVTTFLAFVSPAGLVRWCSAGQGPIIIWQRGTARMLDANLPPMGIIDTFLAQNPPPLELAKDGCLIVPSDGVVEAFDVRQQQFGDAGIVRSLQSYFDLAPYRAIERMIGDIEAWQGKSEPADDQTLVIVRATGSVSSEMSVPYEANNTIDRAHPH